MTQEEERRAIGIRNEAERRAIGIRNEAERRGIGIRNEAERRGIGARIEAERRGVSVEDINRLVTPSREAATLPAVEKRGAVAPALGVGNYTAPAGQAGIASPLEEVLDAKGNSTRTYHEEVTWQYSVDYLLAVEIKPLASLLMKDANKEQVLLTFAAPKKT